LRLAAAGGIKKAEVEAIQETLSVVYVIKGQALLYHEQQINCNISSQQIGCNRSGRNRVTCRHTVQSGFGKIAEAVIGCSCLCDWLGWLPVLVFDPLPLLKFACRLVFNSPEMPAFGYPFALEKLLHIHLVVFEPPNRRPTGPVLIRRQ
jgi:hypothetical protein